MAEKINKNNDGVIIRVQGPVIDVVFKGDVPEVYEALEVDMPNGIKLTLETEFQMGTLRADLDRFLEGSPIIVGYRRARHAYMKRLYPGRVKFGKLEAATQDQNIGFLVGLPKLMYLSERNAWIAII